MIVGKTGAQVRDVYTVARYQGGWAVEHNGAYSDASSSKEEAKAAAHKHARAAHDAGRACQVTVGDETGYFTASRGEGAR